MELREQLQASLGGAYSLDRELPGSGMSHVFVAQETALGRTVVVKVLPPNLAASLSADRFAREIRLAASLQQANIVPVLSAGEVLGLPYYTMPYVEGESLRAHLARQGTLSTAEAVSILRDVAKALAYAHAHNVVHRDIKPDNVLLSGGTAVVTDFGIAKALSASITQGSTPTITQFGTSLGTPAYMAPEQAAGDPAVDLRADLYAFGCMAYELLTGRLPFHGRTAQQMLAAHLTERPPPLDEVRPDLPEPLARLVMRCLEKSPGARPPGAAELVRVLESLSASGSGGEPAAVPAMLLGGRAMLRKALLLYVAAFVVVAAVAKVAIVGIGLPDWVFPGALIVMALGLPVILFTGFVYYQTHRAVAQTPVRTPGGTRRNSTATTLALKASPHVSWRRTAAGGAFALALFALAVGGFMTLRALGIGPAGSLLAAGRLADRDRLLVTDFSATGPDSTLGSVVAEAVRANLAQSPVVSVVQPTAVVSTLRRMQRVGIGRVDLALAREIALREGVKAIVDGDVRPLGAGFLVTLRLVAADSGQELVSYRETADGPAELIGTVDALSRRLRGKIGESLKGVRASPPLERVTTPSLEALRKYALGGHAYSFEGDYAKGEALLAEAIAIDTSFAMAYRKLGMEAKNRGGQRARVEELVRKAYEHRDRLSDLERELATAAYWSDGPNPDEAKALAAYQAALAIDPNNIIALNNSALLYETRRDFVTAERYFVRTLELDTLSRTSYTNLAGEQFRNGKTAEAWRTVERAERALPPGPDLVAIRVVMLEALGEIDSSQVLARRIQADRETPLVWRQRAARTDGAVEIMHGRLANGRRIWRDSRRFAQARGVATAPLEAELDMAQLDAWYLGDRAGALRTIEAALARYPLESFPVSERPYTRLASLFALVGRPDRARAMIAGAEQQAAGSRSTEDQAWVHAARGELAIAEGRAEDAVREYREADEGDCTTCRLYGLARAYDLAGASDSAIAVTERYLADRYTPRVNEDAFARAPAYKRLGELWEQKGDRPKAMANYERFVELWKDADPELQPTVAEVRRRLGQPADATPARTVAAAATHRGAPAPARRAEPR